MPLLLLFDDNNINIDDDVDDSHDNETNTFKTGTTSQKFVGKRFVERN